MGSATLRERTAQDLQDERAQLLSQVDLTIEQLERLAEAGALKEDEYRVWRRLRSLAWLADA